MPRLLLFYRLMARPLLREPVRAGLTVLAVALGVAVVLAIDLAVTQLPDRFRSSWKRWPETMIWRSQRPAACRRIWWARWLPSVLNSNLAAHRGLRGHHRDEEVTSSIGLDLVSETSDFSRMDSGRAAETPFPITLEEEFENSGGFDSIWVGASLGFKVGRPRPITNQRSGPRLCDSRRVSRFERERIRHCDGHINGTTRVDSLWPSRQDLVEGQKTPSLEEWRTVWVPCFPPGSSCVRKGQARTKIAACWRRSAGICGS